MIELTEKQHDALKEVCNIGVSRAARQLSSLTKQDIVITVPAIIVSTILEVINIFRLSREEKCPSISLHMSGSLKGVTILLLESEKDSERLAAMLEQKLPIPQQEATTKEEVLVEAGNIIISSALGAMGDTLGKEVVLEIPKYKNTGIYDALRIDDPTDEEVHTVLAISAELYVKEQDVRSKLLLIFEMDDVPLLLEQLDKL